MYGYEALKKMSAAEVKDSVEKVWTEIVLSSKKKEQVVLPKLDPVEPKKSILGLVIKPAAPSNLKVAFVYDKTLPVQCGHIVMNWGVLICRISLVMRWIAVRSAMSILRQSLLSV